MSLDWKKCINCQESTREALKCPLNGNRPPEANRQTYLDFLRNVNSFREEGSLPVELKVVLRPKKNNSLFLWISKLC